jgi:uncharacterized protein YkwD
MAVAVAVGVSGVEPKEAAASSSDDDTVRTCPSSDPVDPPLSSDEKRLLDLHNQARTSRGKPALCVHSALTYAARAHSQDMPNRDYFSHTSPNGKTVKQRLQSFGYTFNRSSYYTYGENLAWGSGNPYATADYLFKGWMKSKQHKRNILRDSFREVGIGVETGTYKTYDDAKMATVDFGVRR